MKLTSFIKYGLMTIISKRNPQLGQYLPLYHSENFTNLQNLDHTLNNSPIALQRYKEILPLNVLNSTGFYQKKILTIKLEFNPQIQTLRIFTVRLPKIILKQQFHVNNIIPWSYRDMMAMSKWPEPIIPPFLDDEMLYLNKLLKEAYIFEMDGVWNQQTVNHPKLSIEQRFNEQDWFHPWPMI